MTPFAGWIALAAGVLLWPGRVRASARDTPARRTSARHGAASTAVPLMLDLAAAALRSGHPVAEALTLAAPAAGPETAAATAQVAWLLRLGADPVQAWRAVGSAGPLGEVARIAARSSASGLRLAGAFERLAADMRSERAAAAAARAHRAGVSALGPLAACFLPSFVCLGVIPAIAGIAHAVLSGIP